MFDKISRSWHLVKASAGVLRSDKELLLFPVISGIATLLVAATFMVPVLGLRLLEGGDIGPLGFVMLFLFYVTQYFVIFFFNTALVGAAMVRLEGGDPTVADGLRIARGKLGAILGYAAIAATVGLLLKAASERAGAFGKILIGLLGMAWTVGTFLVVPILVTRDVGPIDAVKESMTLLKRTWGENVAGNVGIGGGNPVRVQSMITSDTRDTPACVAEVRRCSSSANRCIVRASKACRSRQFLITS